MTDPHQNQPPVGGAAAEPPGTNDAEIDVEAVPDVPMEDDSKEEAEEEEPATEEIVEAPADTGPTDSQAADVD